LDHTKNTENTKEIRKEIKYFKKRKESGKQYQNTKKRRTKKNGVAEKTRCGTKIKPQKRKKKTKKKKQKRSANQHLVFSFLSFL